MMRAALAFLIALLPPRLRRFSLKTFFGFEIDRTARVGVSLLLPRYLSMGPGATIGHLTVVKGVEEVVLGESSSIGNLNWITGYPRRRDSGPFSDQPNRQPRLAMGDHAALTNRHIVDCTDSVTIGRFATVAGFRTQILTHSISLSESRQRSEPVVIGDYTFVGTGSILLPGSELPPHSVLGAGSVLGKRYLEQYWIYAGNPAVPAKQLNRDAAYFSRPTGYVL